MREGLLSKDDQKKVNICASETEEAGVKLLEANQEEIKYYLINYSPIIFINGTFYKGNYDDTTSLMGAFCNSFENMPEKCNNLNIYKGFSNFQQVGILKFVAYTILIVLGSIILTLLAFYLGYRRKMQK